MVHEKVKAIIEAEKEAEAIIARAREESEKSLKQTEAAAARILKEAEEAAEAEIKSLESESEKTNRGDLEDYRRQTQDRLEAIDKRAGDGFEDAVTLVLSHLM